MVLTAEKKTELFKKYGKSIENTGTPESQIAIFTARINHLTEHLKTHKKDYGTQRALLRLVGKRRRLLDYYKEKDINAYRKLLKSLSLRK
jgi:small subunit ribosomal protein S15